MHQIISKLVIEASINVRPNNSQSDLMLESFTLSVGIKVHLTSTCFSLMTLN